MYVLMGCMKGEEHRMSPNNKKIDKMNRKKRNLLMNKFSDNASLPHLKAKDFMDAFIPIVLARLLASAGKDNCL